MKSKAIGRLFAPSKTIIYIRNLDSNGMGMSYPMLDEDLSGSARSRGGSSISFHRENQATMYFVDCDLEYPPEHHDLVNDYPLGGKRVTGTPTFLSDKQVEVARHDSRVQTQKAVKFLLCLHNKVTYVTH